MYFLPKYRECDLAYFNNAKVLLIGYTSINATLSAPAELKIPFEDKNEHEHRVSNV